MIIMVTSVFRANEDLTDRIKKIEEDAMRSKFQRDRDRILYSKEFRRLSGKTQVFIAGFDDHMRTRLTHTLEVVQIADTVARALGLNEILVEAISYGHDVGHTPFGHVGERTLNLIMNGCKDIYKFNDNLLDNEKGFKHNFQGYRVTTKLEKQNEEDYGLNLTSYTLWGILNHSKLEYGTCEYFGTDNKCKLQNRNSVCKKNGKQSLAFYNIDQLKDARDWTFEAMVVAIADEIAQRHHDIEDGIYAGIIEKKELIGQWNGFFSNLFTKNEKKLIGRIDDSISTSEMIKYTSKLIVSFYTERYVNHLSAILVDIEDSFNIKNHKDFLDRKEEIYDHFFKKDGNITKSLGFEKSFAIKDKKIQQYLKEKILFSELAQSMDGRADFIIRQLFKAYLSNPQQLSNNTIDTIYKNHTNKNVEGDISSREFLKDKLEDPASSIKMQKIVLRTVCDYIAGMTDSFAMMQYQKLYGTQTFRNY